jgi:hypothetical protein
MKIAPLALISILISIQLVLTKCTTTNYYLNAFNGNNHYYHTIPLKSDSIRSATYFNSNIALGSANAMHNDVKSITLNLHRSHTFKLIQAHYGIDFSIGRYHVTKEFPRANSITDTTIINEINRNSGAKLFGGYGFEGGLNLVVPIKKNGSEWRILGIETSMQNEFGQYLKFRRILKDSIAQENMKSSFFPTIGITTEFINKIGEGAFGYKISVGTSLKKEDQNKIGLGGILTSYSNNPFYFVQTLHWTGKKWTIFGQLTFATYSVFLQGGFNYYLEFKHK